MVPNNSIPNVAKKTKPLEKQRETLYCYVSEGILWTGFCNQYLLNKRKISVSFYVLSSFGFRSQQCNGFLPCIPLPLQLRVMSRRFALSWNSLGLIVSITLSCSPFTSRFGFRQVESVLKILGFLKGWGRDFVSYKGLRGNFVFRAFFSFLYHLLYI